MFRLFVVRKKTRKSIIPVQIFFPFTILLQKHMANPDSASVHLGRGKGCFKSLLSAAAAAAKTFCEQSFWNGCFGEGHTDNECTIGLTCSKFRFYPKISAILIKSGVSPAEAAAGSAVRAFPSPLHACGLCQVSTLQGLAGRLELVFFINICMGTLYDL